MPTPVEFADTHRKRFESELSDLLRIPSISTLPDHRDDTRRAAHWIAEYLRSMDLPVELTETVGYPLVYAEWLGAPAHPSRLRTLRRATRRPARSVDVAPVPTRRARRPVVRARGRGRQRPDPDVDRGDAGLPADGRQTAD